MALILHCYVTLNLNTFIRNPNPNPNLDHEFVGCLKFESHFCIPIQSCRSHFHTAAGLRSFPFVVSLSFPYSRRATLISIQSCRSHFHTAVGLRSFYIAVSLSFSYSGRAALILHCRVALIVIQRSDYSTLILHVSCVASLSLSRVARCIPRAVKGVKM